MQNSTFNCHDHRDELCVSDFYTVYHEVHGVLCQGLRHGCFTIFMPIQFKDKAAAQRWIEKGCIADIQEGLHNLKVGFTNNTMQMLHDPFKIQQEEVEPVIVHGA